MPIRLFSMATVRKAATLAAILSLPAAQATASVPHRAGSPVAMRQLEATQIVDRFTFGSTPGLVQSVEAQGWEAWFAQQLQPDNVPDAALQQRLAQLPSLSMTPAQLAVNFPDGQAIRRIAMHKEAMPTDPRLVAVYQVLVARYQQRQLQKADSPASTAAVPAAGAKPSGADAAIPPDPDQPARQRAPVLAGPLLSLAPGQRLNAVLALPLQDRVAITQGLRDPLRTQLLAGMPPRDREMWQTMSGGGEGVITSELEQAKLLRAILGQRQLQEVMTNFWFNHFNVDIGKAAPEADYIGAFERDAIRPHALGKFSDLLLATAQSPAMMLYLDNSESIGPDSPAAGRAGKNGAARGLNENYGREVMELHTVGVNGGYSQADVTALASILTGWTVDQPQRGGPFAFEPRRHEPGPKQWMGRTVPEGGMQEGMQALTALANSPATARHVSYELAQRFVNDTPPPAVVDAMVAAWQSSDGDISAVLTAMVHAPGFFNHANFDNKVKSPLEFVASAMRATQTPATNPAVLATWLRTMGEPLYRCPAPPGYPNVGAGWMNSDALVNRLNFALALGEDRLGGMRLDGPALLADAIWTEPEPRARASTVQPAALRMPATRESQEAPGEQRALVLMEQALGTDTPAATNRVILEQLESRFPGGNGASQPPDHAAELNAIAAMIIGSPGFQLH